MTVISGFLGSGKTTLLNRLLNGEPGSGAGSDAGRTVVLINELGDVRLEHERFRQLSDRVVLLESGCICCAVRGDLVDALRQMFLDALYKRIPPFSRILLETTGLADPAPVMYTLQYERFLADRYVYAGCITVVDAVHGMAQLQLHPEAVQQAVLADVLLLSKTDVTNNEETLALQQELQRLNTSAATLTTHVQPGLDALLDMAAQAPWHKAGQRSMWSGQAMGPRGGHAAVNVLTLAWAQPWGRAQGVRGLTRLLEAMGTGLLRLKGRVQFEGEQHASAVHAVHQHLYPLQEIINAQPVFPQEDGASVLLFIFRGLEAATVLAQIQASLPHGGRVLSSGGNFIQ